MATENAENEHVTDETRSVSRRRPGRTLLLKLPEQNEDGESQELKLEYEGVQSTVDTKTNSRFMVFDTVDNATAALTDLREKGFRVKYSYYKVFFRVKNMDLSDTTYDDLKAKLMDKLKSVDDNVNILYFKLYRKNGSLTGSGDFVLDLKDSLDALVEMIRVELDDQENGPELYMYRFNRGNYRFRKRNNTSNSAVVAI